MKTRDALRVILIIIAAVLTTLAVLYGFYLLSSIVLLVILAIFFAYLVAPLVDLVDNASRLTKYDIPRPLAIGLVYLGLLIALSVSLYFLLPYLGDQANQLKEAAPGYVKGLREKAQQYNDVYGQKLPLAVRESIKQRSREKIEEIAVYVTQEVPSALFNITLALIHYLPWLFLVPILAFFMLKDAGDFRAAALEILPRGRWRWRGDELFQDLNRTLAAYIRAQLIACFLIGSICTLAFLLLGVPYALLLGVLAGFLEFIPLVGPLVVAIIAALLTFAVTTSGNQVGIVLLFLLVLRLVHDYVTYPRIIGQGIHLHPLAVILSVLAGAELAGLPGVFLAVPVMATASVLHQNWLEHRGGEGLVADMLAAPAPVRRGKKKDEAAPMLVLDAAHPTHDTTPEDMARSRPDLLTGELRADKLK